MSLCLFIADRCSGLSFGHKEADMTDAERRVVAIVDDDLAVRESLRFLLETIGCPVEAFATADDFLHSRTDHPVCLIVDHNMPHMTGIELVERLRVGGASIPVLLITGAPSPFIVARAAELGISRVLGKPVAEQDLLDFIDAARA